MVKLQNSLSSQIENLRGLDHPLRSPYPTQDLGRLMAKFLPTLLKRRHYEILASQLPDAAPDERAVPTLGEEVYAAVVAWGGRFLSEAVIRQSFEALKIQGRDQLAGELAKVEGEIDKYRQPMIRNIEVGQHVHSLLSPWAKLTDVRLYTVRKLLTKRDDLAVRVAAFDDAGFDAMVTELARTLPAYAHSLAPVAPATTN